MPTVQTNGIDTAYTDQGQGAGPAVVLIHGFPYNKSMWDDQVAALSGSNRVITYDLRGHGESGATSETYTMEMLAEDLHVLIEELSLGEVALGGFSMGGYVALAFAEAYPEHIDKLMLLDTRHLPDSEQAAEGRENLAKQVEADGVEGVATGLPARMLTEATVSGRPEVAAKASDMIRAASPAGVAGAARGMAVRVDQSDLLPSIAVPTLIVVGEEDGITPPADAEAMAAAVYNSTLVKIPGASHLSNLDKPDEFNKALIDFLSA
jgi:pimeloyl-ACP methyl ester carboxylesterase